MIDDNCNQLQAGDKVTCIPALGDIQTAILGPHDAEIAKNHDGELVIVTTSAFSGRPVFLQRDQWQVFKK